MQLLLSFWITSLITEIATSFVFIAWLHFKVFCSKPGYRYNRDKSHFKYCIKSLEKKPHTYLAPCVLVTTNRSGLIGLCHCVICGEHGSTVWTEGLILLPLFQVPWPGSGGNEKFFFENETVSTAACVKCIVEKAVVSHFNQFRLALAKER